MLLLIEDSRQQADKHRIKHQKFREMGVMWTRNALVCGDYQLPGKSNVAVDTKYSIAELESDILVHKMSKKDIRISLEKMKEGGIINQTHCEELYHLITDDDSERFAEQEITEYCYSHGISEKDMNKISDLYVKRHGFFHRGLLRAKNYGVKLYILVDNVDDVTDIKSLFKWVNPRRRILVKTNVIDGYYANGKPRYRKVQKYPNAVNGAQLAKSCLTMQSKYGCEFLFCRPEESAEIIIKLLTKDTSH